MLPGCKRDSRSANVEYDSPNGTLSIRYFAKQFMHIHQISHENMYKNLNITQFFKPFVHSRQKKRPLSEDNADEPRPLRRSRSITPEVATSHASVENLFKVGYPPSQTALPDDSSEVSCISANRPFSPKYDFTYSESWTSQKMCPKEEIESPELQGHMKAGSQRFVRDGKVIIRSSDDESESDVSLDDIDDLLVARRHTIASSPLTELDVSHPPSLKQEAVTGTGSGGRRSRSTRANTTCLSSAIPVMPKYKFSLKALEEKAKDDEALEVGSSKAKSLLDSFEHEKITSVGKARRVDKAGDNFDAKLISAVMKEKGDEEGIGRLMTAIERTEAFHHGKIWSFFKTANDPTLLEQGSFPFLDDVHWHGILISLSI